jgi:hypothetical protein
LDAFIGLESAFRQYKAIIPDQDPNRLPYCIWRFVYIVSSSEVGNDKYSTIPLLEERVPSTMMGTVTDIYHQFVEVFIYLFYFSLSDWISGRTEYIRWNASRYSKNTV